MSTLFNLIIVVQVLSALAIVGLVLMQHGKGADMGAAFGSGASGSLFGATGSSNFLSKSTAFAAIIFFACTLALAHYGTPNQSGAADAGVMGRVTVPSTKAPATPGPANGNLPAAPATAPAQAPAQAPAGNAPAPANQIPK
jgi:preprotein translocase subunit SecG